MFIKIFNFHTLHFDSGPTRACNVRIQTKMDNLTCGIVDAYLFLVVLIQSLPMGHALAYQLHSGPHLAGSTTRLLCSSKINIKGYGAIRSKIGLFTFFNFSIVILVDLDALIPNICVFYVLEKSEEPENNSIKSKNHLKNGLSSKNQKLAMPRFRPPGYPHVKGHPPKKK
ncbi:hypothetical protein BpHYR1_043530, partial [Brachionus plicatilis]